MKRKLKNEKEMEESEIKAWIEDSSDGEMRYLNDRENKEMRAHSRHEKIMDRLNRNRILLARASRARWERLDHSKAARARRERELKEAIRAERRKRERRDQLERIPEVEIDEDRIDIGILGGLGGGKRDQPQENMDRLVYREEGLECEELGKEGKRRRGIMRWIWSGN